MSETVKVAEFIAPRQTKNEKWTPSKFRDGNGRVFVISKNDVELVKSREGDTLEIDHDPLNKYNEYPLTSVRVPAPPPDLPTVKTGSWGKSPDEAARICRQNALTNAVAFIDTLWKHITPGTHPTTAGVLSVAQEFAAWNLDGTIPQREQKTQGVPGKLTTGLRMGETLQQAAQRALAEQEADFLSNIPPADAADEQGPSNRTPYPRETLRASGPARR